MKKNLPSALYASLLIVVVASCQKAAIEPVVAPVNYSITSKVEIQIRKDWSYPSLVATAYFRLHSGATVPAGELYCNDINFSLTKPSSPGLSFSYHEPNNDYYYSESLPESAGGTRKWRCTGDTVDNVITMPFNWTDNKALPDTLPMLHHVNLADTFKLNFSDADSVQVYGLYATDYTAYYIPDPFKAKTVNGRSISFSPSELA